MDLNARQKWLIEGARRALEAWANTAEVRAKLAPGEHIAYDIGIKVSPFIVRVTTSELVHGSSLPQKGGVHPKTRLNFQQKTNRKGKLLSPLTLESDAEVEEFLSNFTGDILFYLKTVLEHNNEPMPRGTRDIKSLSTDDEKERFYRGQSGFRKLNFMWKGKLVKKIAGRKEHTRQSQLWLQA